MPTPEEIKKICTEYVDELFAYDDMQDQENIEAKNDAFVMCMAFAGHILEKHCIVPKSEVIGLWNEINNDAKINIENGFPDYAEFNKLQLTPIEILFGTELFNEEKE